MIVKEKNIECCLGRARLANANSVHNKIIYRHISINAFWLVIDSGLIEMLTNRESNTILKEEIESKCSE